MEINLVLTAKSWQLASQLQRTKPYGRVLMVKNVPEQSYLLITAKQWQVLSRFEQPHTVPEILEDIHGAILEEHAFTYMISFTTIFTRFTAIP